MISVKNWKFLNCFFWGKIGLGKVFGNVLHRKQAAYLAYNFKMFLFGQVKSRQSVELCWYGSTDTKQAFLDYKNNDFSMVAKME